ncbi:MAG: non-homologous end-joining DNA ligase [Candidatus Methanospirareceae archaeon]
MISPMLCETAEQPPNSDRYIYEIKYDGERVVCHVSNGGVRLQNRCGNDITHRYPELHGISQFVSGDAILDGELCIFEDAFKTDFQKMQVRAHLEDRLRIRLLSRQMPVTYVAFDILSLDGESLVNSPLLKRKEILDRTVKKSDRIVTSDYWTDGLALYDFVVKNGLEGIVAKRKDSRYEIGKRSRSWLKVKFTKTIDCVICGYTRGEGVRKNTFGSLVLGCYDNGKLRYVGKVGSGISDRDLVRIREMIDTPADCPFDADEVSDEVTWVEPKHVCEVEYLNLSNTHKLRQPIFVRMRRDKNIKQCSLSQGIIGGENEGDSFGIPGRC